MVTVLLIEGPQPQTPMGPQLGLIAAIATAGAILDATGLCAVIDWPNDVVINGRKVAGVLVESCVVTGQRRAYAVGIGINCLQHGPHFPEELRTRATSLYMESTTPIDRESVASALLVGLDRRLADPAHCAPAEVRAEFLRWASPLGGRVRVVAEGRVFEGQVVDVDPSSALVVQLDGGGRRHFPAATTSVISGG